MTAEHFRNLLWDMTVLFAVLSPISLASGYYARRKFHALLKAPLNDEVEHLTHVWEERVKRWTVLGLAIPGISILCFVAWLVMTRFATGAA